LALHLAKKYNSELISADSRQVYKGMNIGTGKELPANSKFKIQSSKLPGYYEINEVRVWGYDLVPPTRSFSVAQYKKIIDKVLLTIFNRKKLPILVGGTGLYIKAIIDDISTLGVPRNTNLRKSLLNKTSDELYALLSQFDPIKSASLNVSDKKNPRRLVRAIEVASRINKLSEIKPKKINYNLLLIGLILFRQDLYSKIAKRVDRRIDQGMETEIQKLISSGVRWGNQSMSGMGYKQWEGYFSKKESLKKVIDKWKVAERSYSRKQIAWFKKDKRITWFDIANKGYPQNVESLVRKWYKETS